jgi:hypothetical protein
VRRPVVLALLLLAPACRIERTPQELIDPMNPAIVNRREADREIALRIAALRGAIARGSPADAVDALAPLPEAHVIGPDEQEGRPRFGSSGLTEALARVPTAERVLVRTPDLRIQSDTREMFAWFATHLEVLPLAPGRGPAERYRVSGVFRRVEGSWRLSHLHLSRGQPEPPTPGSGAEVGVGARPGGG